MQKLGGLFLDHIDKMQRELIVTVLDA